MERSTKNDNVTADAVVQLRVRVLPDGRMTREHAATYLGLKVKTLAMWAMQGKGPRSIRVGGRAFYRKSDLDAYIGGRNGGASESDT
jgi:Helix-turn-helix domain